MICLSRSTRNKNVISYRFDERVCDRYKNMDSQPIKTEVDIYPYYNYKRDFFDIKIILSKITRGFKRSMVTIISGDQQEEQNKFIEYLLGPVSHEVWFKDRLTSYFDCLDIPFTHVRNKELLTLIQQANQREMKICETCGSLISKTNETGICNQCKSKLLSTVNHGYHIKPLSEF